MKNDTCEKKKLEEEVLRKFAEDPRRLALYSNKFNFNKYYFNNFNNFLI